LAGNANKREAQVREEAMDLNMPQFSKIYHLVLHPLIHYSCSAHVSFLIKSNALAASHYNL
jgi:hypothetical protein